MFVNVPAPVPPLVTPNVPEVIAEVSIAMAVLFAELIRPFASTLNEATADAVPWLAAVIVKLVKSVLAAAKAPLAYTPALLAAVNAAVILLFCVVSVAVAALAAAKAPLA